MTTQTVTIGRPAPNFQLSAIGSNRAVSSVGSAQLALLLVFHDQNTSTLVQQMQEAVRMQHPDAQRLLIASIVNMSVVPAPLRPMAESVMKASYTQAAAVMPKGLDAADYVVILIDWTGKVSKAYGASKVSKQPLMVLIDSQGCVRGLYQGTQLSSAALQMLGELGEGAGSSADNGLPTASSGQDGDPAGT